MVVLRPDADRRLDPLRGHERDQHGAAVPHAATWRSFGRRRHYTVGDIVAYRSNLLHTVVLHRIVANVDGSYVCLQGRQQRLHRPGPSYARDLLGKLWLHIPHGGRGARPCCTRRSGPRSCVQSSASCRSSEPRRTGGGVSVAGSSATGSAHSGFFIVNNARDHGGARPFNYGALLTTSAIAAAVFVVLALVAFTRPDQQAHHGHDALLAAGDLRLQRPRASPARSIPTGASSTRATRSSSRLCIRSASTSTTPIATAAAHDVAGTEDILLRSPPRADGAARSCSRRPRSSPATTPAPW